MSEVPDLRAMIPLTDHEILTEFDEARNKNIVSKVVVPDAFGEKLLVAQKDFGSYLLLTGVSSLLLLIIGHKTLRSFNMIKGEITDNVMLYVVSLTLITVGTAIVYADVGLRRPTHPIVLESALRSLLAKGQESIEDHEKEAEERIKWISRIHRLDTLMRRRRQSLSAANNENERQRLTNEIDQLENDRTNWVQFVEQFDNEQSELFEIKRQIEAFAEPVLLALATRDASAVIAKADVVAGEVREYADERASQTRELAYTAESIRDQLLRLQARASERRKAEARLRE